MIQKWIEKKEGKWNRRTGRRKQKELARKERMTQTEGGREREGKGVD